MSALLRFSKYKGATGMNLHEEFLFTTNILINNQRYPEAISRLYYSILHYMADYIELHGNITIDRPNQSRIIETYRKITECDVDINKFKAFREMCDYERNIKKRKTSNLFLLDIINKMNTFLQQQIHIADSHKLQPSSVF